MNSMVWKLLRKNISAGQIAGYALANLLGLSIILCAVALYGQVRPLFQSPRDLNGTEYITISHPVSTLTTLGVKGQDSFSDNDMADIRRQPWASRVGQFTPAQFDVTAHVDIRGAGMATALFLESVPDEFLDVQPEHWDWRPGEPVPVVIPRDYLSLYNFGFASSRGLPQLSESLLSNVPMTLTLAGNGLSQQVPARIAGFTSRLNTIAVPAAFMQEMNSRLANPDAPSAPSRLIIEVNTPGDPQIRRYLDQHGYQAGGEDSGAGKAAFVLTALTAVVTAVGAVITLLSVLVLTLSIFLLLQKNRRELSNLLSLGYSPAQVSAPYSILTATVNASVTVLGVAIVLLARSWWTTRLASLGAPATSMLPVILTALALMASLTALNILSIRRAIRRLF